MVVKNIDAVKAFTSLSDLNRHKFNDGHIARKVYNLMNSLQPVFEFQVQEERKIYKEHPNYDPRNHGINFAEKGILREDAQKEIEQIDAELEKLANLESDVAYEAFEIDLSKESVPLSGEDYGNLRNFVNFV